MSIHEQLEIVGPDGSVSFVDLDPSLGVFNVGRHEGNDIVLPHNDVEPFHGLIDFRESPVRFIDLSMVAEVDARYGSAEVGQMVNPWQPFAIGPYELFLVGDKSRPSTDAPLSRLPSQPAHPSSFQHQHALSGPQSEIPSGMQPFQQPSQAVPSRNDYQNGVQRPGSAHGQLHAVPGGTAQHTLTIDNYGATTANFIVSVGGVPTDWLHLSASQFTLAQDESQSVSITVTTPNSPDTIGVYQIQWQIVSPQYPGWQNQGRIELTVGFPQTSREGQPSRADNFSVSELSTPEFTSRFMRQGGNAHFRVRNESPVPLSLVIAGRSLRGTCQFHFAADGHTLPTLDKRGSRFGLDLPPFAESTITATVRPEDLHLFGLGKQTHRFTIQLADYAPQAIVAAERGKVLSGTFHSRPMVNLGVFALLFMLAILATIFLYRQNIGEWVEGIVYPAVIETRLGDALPTPAPASISESFSAQNMSVGGPTSLEEESFQWMFEEVGTLYNIDWRLLASHAYRESLLDPNAMGQAGEYGLMQIMPATWDEWAPLVSMQNPWDPYSNITVGAAYYAFLRSYFEDLGYTDPRWALAAYNWGPERVVTILDDGGNWYRVPLPQRQYVADILIGINQAPEWVEQADLVSR